MSSSQNFSCFLVGAESLLIACGEILLEGGNEVRGVIAAAPAIADWAAQKGIPVIDPTSDYFDVLSNRPFDYLLSITNLEILPDRVIALPARGAINFHDGPLPRYGGLYAPVWALIDRQSSHGITWHLMTGSADAGDIVEQVMFDIVEGETSLTLNTKCYSAGIDSFAAVVKAMRHAALPSRSHALDRSTFHTRSQRPSGNCAIYWSKSRDEISALARALDFGPYPNPFGVPRLVVGEQTVLVRTVDATGNAARSTPGTVVAIDDSGITISAADGNLVLSRLSTVEGAPLTARECAKKLGLEIGARISDPNADYTSRADEMAKTLYKNERFWESRLSSSDRVELPYESAVISHAATISHRSMHIDDDMLKALERLAETSRSDFLSAAFVAYVARLSGKYFFDIGFEYPALARQRAENEFTIAPQVSLRMSSDGRMKSSEVIADLLREIAVVRKHGPIARDITARYPALQNWRPPSIAVVQASSIDAIQSPAATLSVLVAEDAKSLSWAYSAEAISSEHVERMQEQFATFLRELDASWDAPISANAILSDNDRLQMLEEWNATAAEVPGDVCIHQLIEKQARLTPNAVAAIYGESRLTYRQLDERSNQLARYLRSLEVRPEVLVGVCMDRSLEMMIALLAIHKAGGAYVPLDPRYPSSRIALMLEDANVSVLLTQQRLLDSLPATRSTVVCVDQADDLIDRQSSEGIDSNTSPDNLAYVIYTSGSTGKPKGVMVEHRNVVNFFAGMDERIGSRDPGVWLAVTSLSFDISVLELFWTLARGFTVVIYAEPERNAPRAKRTTSSRALDFSLFYFSADEEEKGAEKYKLLLEGARFADANGFTAVWTPERHFHRFGGLYPNPAVTGAAVAAITQNVAIRAGSCVLPLHHPLRVAEEWSVVDNISNGRVGISFAAGWQPNDFVLRPENFADARNVMLRDIETVRKLWRGESLTLAGPTGKDVTVSILPRPVQAELPFWLTTAGNPASFEAAGKVGANVLTHLLGQSISELGAKLALYRKAWKEAGHPGEGFVSLMLHTFVGDDDAEVKEIVRQPMKDYLRTSISLIKPYASAFPTFRKSNPDGTPQELDFASLTAEEMESLLEYSFERYYATSGLFGTPETCAAIVEELRAIGVDDIACLIDFGADAELVLEHLADLNRVRLDATSGAEDHSIPALIERHGVTHMQCTPSMATMLVGDQHARAALGKLRTLLIGGEAFPPALAEELGSATRAAVINMYGPTETTVWSTTYSLNGAQDSIPIGRPIANTQLYVVDSSRQPVPVGTPGELLIGGNGVVRGYLRRDDLTMERFIDVDFGARGGRRVYRTGDLVRYRGDGNVEFLGRLDHQVKIRGHRIELGEVESALMRHPEVRETVVVAREDSPGDKRLVAYVVPGTRAQGLPLKLREHVRGVLPEQMVPSHFVLLDQLPRTPNGKLDRNALPAPDAAVNLVAQVQPENELEQLIAGIWQDVLKVPQVGTSDNFFDLGGHSLLAVQVHGRLRKVAPREISITDLFRFPTIRSLADHLAQPGSDDSAIRKGMGRAEARRQSMTRRQQRR